MKGELTPPVSITSKDVIVASSRYKISDIENIAFLGTQIYATKDIKAVIPAIISAGKLTSSDLLNSVLFEKKVQKYSAIMAIDTKKVASQIRRCQKRFIANGFILPPIFYTDLMDIMTIMLCFYKWRYF